MSQAETAYAIQHAAAAALIDLLQQALYDMPAPDSGTPIDWGHVGSAAEIARQLGETLAFATNTNA